MSFDLELTQRRTLLTGATKGVGAAAVGVLREVGAEWRPGPACFAARCLHHRREYVIGGGTVPTV